MIPKIDITENNKCWLELYHKNIQETFFSEALFSSNTEADMHSAQNPSTFLYEQTKPMSTNKFTPIKFFIYA